MNTPLYSVIDRQTDRQIKHKCTHTCMCTFMSVHVPVMHSTDPKFSQSDKRMWGRSYKHTKNINI